MRKNQYEEALFKIEDERFEIEMGIEINKAVLKVRTYLWGGRRGFSCGAHF